MRIQLLSTVGLGLGLARAPGAEKKEKWINDLKAAKIFVQR
jgi:hypothetical protein